MTGSAIEKLAKKTLEPAANRMGTATPEGQRIREELTKFVRSAKQGGVGVDLASHWSLIQIMDTMITSIDDVIGWDPNPTKLQTTLDVVAQRLSDSVDRVTYSLETVERNVSIKSDPAKGIWERIDQVARLLGIPSHRLNGKNASDQVALLARDLQDKANLGGGEHKGMMFLQPVIVAGGGGDGGGVRAWQHDDTPLIERDPRFVNRVDRQTSLIRVAGQRGGRSCKEILPVLVEAVTKNTKNVGLDSLELLQKLEKLTQWLSVELGKMEDDLGGIPRHLREDTDLSARFAAVFTATGKIRSGKTFEDDLDVLHEYMHGPVAPKSFTNAPMW